MTKTHTLLILAALSGSVFSIPAYAGDTDTETVVSVRRTAVPEPRSGDMRLNTARAASADTAIVRSPGTTVPGTSNVIVPSPAGSPVLNLEQQGVPPDARTAAQNTGVVQIRPDVAPASDAGSASQVSTPDASQNGSPPPPVYQTMKQAADAGVAETPSVPAMKMEAPVVVEPSLYNQAEALYAQAVVLAKAYPLALPGFAVFVMLLAIMFKRSSSKRRSDESEQ